VTTRQTRGTLLLSLVQTGAESAAYRCPALAIAVVDQAVPRGRLRLSSLYRDHLCQH
jgi:hypothetical protein